MGIFSKTIDYNLILENVLEGKSFSESAKSILLNMLYKIEISYEDYAKVKNIKITKSQFISDIVRIISEYIEFVENVEPFSDEASILEKHRTIAITNEEEKTVLSYPTESAMLYAIADIMPKYFYISDEFLLKNEFQNMLVEGSNLNTLELLENFNGWSWNPKLRIEKGYISNIIYQNLIMMFGFNFIEMCKTSDTKEYDIAKIIKNYNKQYYNALIEVIYLENKTSKLDLQIKSKILKLRKKIKESKDVENLQEKKNCLLKKIEKIDSAISDKIVLNKAFQLKNSKLKKEQKISDIKDFLKSLKIEKKEYEEKIKKLEKLQNPKKIKQYENELKVCEYIISLDKTVEEANLELQKIFIKILYQKSKDIKTKDEFIDLIFKIRYYRNIFVSNKKAIKNYPELNKLLNKIFKNIITLGTKNAFIRMVSYNVNLNYDILMNCLNSNCIDLRKLKFKLDILDKKMVVEVFDNEIFEKSFEIAFAGENPELTVKKKKIIKVFN